MKRNVYSRPDKPLKIAVREISRTEKPEHKPLPTPVFVDKATECHVTPNRVAFRMVEYLGPRRPFSLLEPQAGTGALIDVLLQNGYEQSDIVAIERHNTLAGGLLYKDVNVINRCFLDYASEGQGYIQYPRIIMNPPFSAVRAHMASALSLLGRGGHKKSAVLVALVPITYQHPDAEELEILPDDTFSTAKVNTKIIRITR